jgi:hypothetical protein
MTIKQAEGMWEAYIPSLSPLQVLKAIPDPSEVLSIHDWEIHTGNPSESSDSESDSGSDDGSLSSTSSRSPTERYLSGEITPVDWGATEPFARLADNFLGLSFAPSQTRAGARAIATSTPQARSLRAPTNHQDVHGRERPNQKCRAPRRHAHPSPTLQPARRWSRVPTRYRSARQCEQRLWPQGERAEDRSFSSLIRERRNPRRWAPLFDGKRIHTEGPKPEGTMGQTIGSAQVI